MLPTARARRRTPNPVIPGNTRDRTGTGGILRRANAEIARRYEGLRRDVLALFDAIPVFTINELRAPLFGMTPEQFAELNVQLNAALDRWLLGNRGPAGMFWWSKYLADAAQLGSAQSAVNLANLSEVYASARSLEQIVFSEPFRNRLYMAQEMSLEHWTKLSSEVRATLSTIIGRAVIDGKNPKAVRTEIAEALGVSKGRAAGYAQTDITGALREARMAEAEYARVEMGIATALLWTSALIPTTRPTHAAKNGKVLTTEDVRSFYERDGNRYNCFLPGTLVAGRFVAGIKSRYQGPAVRLVTAGGRQLSVTSNHPVLTARGMVPAAELREGDQLVAYGAEVQGALRVGDLDGGLMGARVEDVFSALVQAGHQFPARVSPVDLHGDAAFVEPDVDVVHAHRELVFALDAACAQLLDDLALVLSDAPAPAGRDLQAFFLARNPAPGRSVRGSSVLPALVRAELGHAVSLRVASASERDTGRGEPSRQGLARDAGPGCDGQHRLTGGVSIDQVLQVEVFHYEGPVFDLQERSGLMLGSNIVTSNCHCAQTECLLDADGKPILTDGLKAKMRAEVAAWEKEQLNLG